MASKGLHLGQIDAVGGNHLQRVVHLHVRGRETYDPAILLAGHHRPVEGVFIAQHPGGRLHLTFGESLAYQGRADSAAPGGHQRGNHQHLHAESLCDRPDRVGQQAVGAQAVVIAEKHGTAAELVAHDRAQIFSGGHRGELAGEVEDFHPVHSGGKYPFLLLVGRGQQPETARVLLQHRPRMIGECNDNRLLPPFAGGGDESPDYSLMTCVDAVEESGSDYSHFTRGKSCL